MNFHVRPLVPFCLVGLAVFIGTLAAGWGLYMQRTVRVKVHLAASVPGGVRVFYCTQQNEAFGEKRSVSVQPSGTPAVADVSVPATRLYRLKIGFGSAPGTFTILGGTVGDIPLPAWKAWTFGPDVTVVRDDRESGELTLFSDKDDPSMSVSFFRPVRSVWKMRRARFACMLALSLFLASVSAAGKFLFGRRGEGGDAKRTHLDMSRTAVFGLSVHEAFFLLACVSYYTAWIFQPFDFSPDEAMRFSVTRFLFENGRLPVGEETVDRTWGVSYAHFPTMFCNVFGALFMKIGSFFSSDATVLLRAARMLGVFCATGTVYWTIRISKILFRAPFAWIPACMVAFLPQFAYVGSYVNNDSPALLGVSMILFAWVAAIDGRWSFGIATVLAVGIAICATSYYNSYAWILFSGLMFPLTYRVRNGRKGLVGMGLFVTGVVFCLAGYLFLRHLVLYGDLLGFSTCRTFAAKFADPGFVPDVKKSVCDSGCSLFSMLFGMKWVSMTASSFVGNFGYMRYLIPSWCRVAYALVLGLGGLGSLWKGLDWIRRRHGGDVCKTALLVSLAGCVALTVGLSVIYSYKWDFQPQGRYCFPALLPIVLCSAKGIERIVEGLVPPVFRSFSVFSVCLLLGVVSEASCYFFVGLYQ